MPINHLLVVSGPKAVGKSHLMERIREGSVPALNEALEIGDPSDWQFQGGVDFDSASALVSPRESLVERLVFHYEITRPWSRRCPARSFADEICLEVLNMAKRVTHLVLWAPCDVLMNRFLTRNARFRSTRAWLRTFYHVRFGIRHLDADFRPLYRDPARVLRIYNDWLTFCRARAPGDFWLLDGTHAELPLVRLHNPLQDLVRQITEWADPDRCAPLRAERLADARRSGSSAGAWQPTYVNSGLESPHHR